MKIIPETKVDVWTWNSIFLLNNLNLNINIFPLNSFHIFEFFDFFKYNAKNIIGKNNPNAYINNNNPPVYAEPAVDANNKIVTRIGPTQGVHEIPIADPNTNDENML